MGRPSPERHLCHCGRGFLRKEHLRRHQATHSTPSFTCKVCSRSFTRSDLLRRHLTLHDVPATTDSKRARACDACHASKIRCDGGDRCSLCSKRGIECTFKRGSVTQSSNVGSVAGASSSRSPEATDSGSVTGTTSTGDSVLDAYSAGYQEPTNPTVVAEPMQGEDASSIALRGLQKVLDAIVDSDPRYGSVPKPHCPVPNELREWSASCLDTYFGIFHDRWPIVHGPSFDQDNDSTIARGSVLMIGAWLQNKDDDRIKSLVFKIHDLLVKRIFNDLTESSIHPTDPWPIRTCQSALLNIVFAFESGKSNMITRARLLFSLLVTMLRHKKVFSSEALEQEVKDHCSGDFPPWIYSCYERWKRIVTYAFKLDTYLSLFANQPPLIQREELDLGLASTFGIWNAFGLDVFFRRWPTEPLERGRYKLSDLALGSQQPVPSGLLVEDVHVRMMGTTNYVWVLNQMRGNPNPAMCVSSDQKDLISARLRRCKLQLDGMASIWEEPELHKKALEYLLRAYSKKEEPFQENWEVSVKTRFVSHVLSATMLYHLLNLHIYADVNTFMEDLPATSPSILERLDPNDPSQLRRAQVQEWAMSAECRFAVMHALLAFRCYRETVASSDLTSEPVDPLAYMTLSAAAAVLWTWAMNVDSSCTCLGMRLLADLDFGFVSLGAAKNPEVESWIRTGGEVSLHGVRLCWCNINVWLSPFAAILSHGAARWEVGDVFAQRLWSKLGQSR